MDLTEEFKDSKSFIHWFLIAALHNVEINDIVQSEPREVTMQLNGVEINPSHALKRMEEQFDSLVEKEVLERIDNLRYAILDPFEEQVEEMTKALKQLCSDKLPKMSDWSLK